MVISFLIFTILAGGKNFARNVLAKSSHVVMVNGGSEFNHAFALSQRENGKSLNLIASSETLLCLKVSHNSRKLTM